MPDASGASYKRPERTLEILAELLRKVDALDAKTDVILARVAPLELVLPALADALALADGDAQLVTLADIYRLAETSPALRAALTRTGLNAVTLGKAFARGATCSAGIVVEDAGAREHGGTLWRIRRER